MAALQLRTMGGSGEASSIFKMSTLHMHQIMYFQIKIKEFPFIGKEKSVLNEWRNTMNANASTQATQGLTEWFDEYKNEQSPALYTVEHPSEIEK